MREKSSLQTAAGQPVRIAQHVKTYSPYEERLQDEEPSDTIYAIMNVHSNQKGRQVSAPRSETRWTRP
jgi:hypothetical protein